MAEAIAETVHVTTTDLTHAMPGQLSPVLSDTAAATASTPTECAAAAADMETLARYLVHVMRSELMPCCGLLVAGRGWVIEAATSINGVMDGTLVLYFTRSSVVGDLVGEDLRLRRQFEIVDGRVADAPLPQMAAEACAAVRAALEKRGALMAKDDLARYAVFLG